MARRIMFHIGLMSNIGRDDRMDESDFYGKLDALSVDYIANQPSVDAKESVNRLVTRLWSAGFKVKLSADPDYEEFYIFDTGDTAELTACKSKYFAAAFASLKEKINQMSLETFASDGTEEFNLRNLINNKNGDAVYFGEMYEAVYSVDSFIRHLMPNTVYYIAPETVLLH